MRQLMKDHGISSIGTLRERMGDAGISIGTSTLHRALLGQGGNRLQSLSKIARFFDVTVDQLLQPELGESTAAPGASTDTPQRRRVPIISWVQAGMWGEIVDNFQPGDADEWAIAFESNPGKHAFALVVRGDSMTNPNPMGPTFPDGTIIIVDPDKAPGPADFVIGKDVQTQAATFKQLTTDGGRWYLRPLNPAYPTIEIDDPGIRVIGRVIEYLRRGKL